VVQLHEDENRAGNENSEKVHDPEKEIARLEPHWYFPPYLAFVSLG
jgi:hypothetical protein